MSSTACTPGAVTALKAERKLDEFTVKVVTLSKTSEGKHKCVVSDGHASMKAAFSTQVATLATGGDIRMGSFLHITDCQLSLVNNEQVLVILECSPLTALGPKLPAAANPSPAEAKPSPDAIPDTIPMETDSLPEGERDSIPEALPALKSEGGPAKENQPQSNVVVKAEPMGASRKPSDSFKTPVALKRQQQAFNTPGPTPPTVERPISAVRPILSLNPYTSTWTIKGKVASKGPLRSCMSRGVQTSLCTVELVDEQGTSIEATLWRDFAEEWQPRLEEGKVYLVSNGRVTVANQKYSRVRNDYTISLDNGARIEECADATFAAVAAKLVYVPIAQLPPLANSKKLIDVLGVVKSVTPLGSVKRKSDGGELWKREITIVDQSAKSVSVTLWSDKAEGAGAELETLLAETPREPPIVSISCCRPSEYNGVSLSTISRSVVEVNPTSPEGVELREWWEGGGSLAEVQAAAEGVGTATKSAAPAERVTIGDLARLTENLVAGDKPLYFDLTLTLTFIDPVQNMYYTANTANKKKVTQNADGNWEQDDGTLAPSMSRRYIFNAQLSDFTGQTTFAVFPEQGEPLLGMPASSLRELKESEDQRPYEAFLRRLQWSTWNARVVCKAEEYQGNVRIRHSLQAVSRLDFVAEGRRLVEEIRKLSTAS